jgi:hypothetical protein
MDTLSLADELARIEALPLEERADALEALERRMRESLDDDASGA